jgi:hypothetical protein
MKNNLYSSLKIYDDYFMPILSFIDFSYLSLMKSTFDKKKKFELNIVPWESIYILKRGFS